MIANGLEPGLRGHAVHPVRLSNGNHVFLIRVPQSLNAPHRVIKTQKFYGRTSAGKYPMDVNDLRAAFLRWGKMSADIKALREERVKLILQAITPIPTRRLPGAVVLHVVPQESIIRPTHRDAREIKAHSRNFSVFDKFVSNRTSFNADGFISYFARQNGNCEAYTQVFRSGIVEYMGVFGEEKEDCSVLTSDYEVYVVNAAESCIAGLGALDIQPPFFVLLSILNLTNTALEPVSTSRRREFQCGYVAAPECEIWGASGLRDALQPAFDVVWNAAGYSRSDNYSESGEWNPR
jgi:hypothetical protein